MKKRKKAPIYSCVDYYFTIRTIPNIVDDMKECVDLIEQNYQEMRQLISGTITGFSPEVVRYNMEDNAKQIHHLLESFETINQKYKKFLSKKRKK